MNPWIILRGLLLIASFVAIGLLLKESEFGAALNSDWVDADIRGHGASGVLIFIGIGAVATAIGLPRQMIAFLGGYAFGFIAGTALSLLATVIGCITSFYYARFLGRNFVQGRFPGRAKRVDEFLSGNPFSMTLLIRLLPAGSNLITNLVVGVSSVSALTFFAGSALGYIPQMMVFALAGSGVTLEPAFRVGLSIVLFVVSGLLGVYLYRKHRRGRVFDATVDKNVGTDEPA